MNEDIEVTINIEMRQPAQYSGAGLRLTDSFKLKSRGFLELAKILAQFDDLAKSINEKG